jgi:hypothetical protein
MKIRTTITNTKVATVCNGQPGVSVKYLVSTSATIIIQKFAKTDTTSYLRMTQILANLYYHIAYI